MNNFEQKKNTILQILKSIENEWDLAKWLIAFIEYWDFDKNILDWIISILENAIKSSKNKIEKNKLEIVKSKLQDLKKQEEIDTKNDNKIAQNLLNDL